MCIDLHQTGFVGEGSDRLQLIKFWLSCAPGKAGCGWVKICGSALRRQTHTSTHPQTGPLTIHCAAASEQCKYISFIATKLLTHFPTPTDCGRGQIWLEVIDSSGVGSAGARCSTVIVAEALSQLSQYNSKKIRRYNNAALARWVARETLQTCKVAIHSQGRIKAQAN